MAKKELGKEVSITIVGDDPCQMCFKISGITGSEDDPDSKEFEGGVYLGIIKQKSLATPPEFMLYTPNGVVETGTYNVCTAISKYHSQQYRPEMKIYGFISNMMGAIKCWRFTKTGIGLMYDGDVMKQSANITRLAKLSVRYNQKHHADILKAFDEEESPELLDGGIIDQLKEVVIEEKKIEESCKKLKTLMGLKKDAEKRHRPVRKKKTA